MPKRKSPNRNPEPRPQPNPDVAPDDPPLQGEGNYTAARRHRESVRDFVDAGLVEDAARHAAPVDETEASELKQAEEAGLSHARK